MKEELKEAFSEVEQIFNLMPIGLLNKIPNEFKKMIIENKSNIYKPNIHEPLEKCNLKYETQVVLAVIYRDFLCTEDERKELLKREKNKLLEFEQELREKYNSDNIFKNRNKSLENVNGDITTETTITEYKEKNFIRKLFDKIKHVFIRK